MWQDQSTSYGQAPAQNYGYAAQPAEPLQFYNENSSFYDSRSGLSGSVGAGGAIPTQPGAQGFIQPVGPWWTAFGTGGFEGEPPLLEGTAIFGVMSCAEFNVDF